MRPGRVVAAVVAAGATAYWVMSSPSSQLLGDFPYRGQTVGPTVALTFDDGPNEPYTSRIADFLASKGIRATFFQVGSCVERHPDVPARLVEQGHVVGNHSFSHQISRCLLRGSQARQTRAAQQILSERLGRAPALYRPPWLLRTPSLFAVLRHDGLRPVSGTFAHAFEAVQPAPARIARRALAKARPGAILIFHDGFDGRGGYRGNTARAVEIVVEELLGRGYTFVTVDEMLGIPAYASL